MHLDHRDPTEEPESSYGGNSGSESSSSGSETDSDEDAEHDHGPQRAEAVQSSGDVMQTPNAVRTS